jgi:hypothetical protein
MIFANGEAADVTLQLLAKHQTYRVLRWTGIAVLITYLFATRDFAFSVGWAFSYLLISVVVGVLLVQLKLTKRFPQLNKYHFSTTDPQAEQVSLQDDAWAVEKVEYLHGSLRGTQLLFTPAEDGLICVPVILAGINPIIAVLGGVAFGVMHLGRFTYFECLGKAIIYTIACAVILPHGVLTLVVGHFATDLFSLGVLSMVRRKFPGQTSKSRLE